jgi:disulfide bond formation protein DsbB
MKTIESVLDHAGRRSATLGQPSPSETPKAPWRPQAAGRIAFFFGPIAGALVAAISLRRMGRQQSAKKLMPLALAVAAVECAILAIWIPVALNPFVGLGAEIAFLFIFPVFMKKEFSEWQAKHPCAMPSNGWNAIGWGLLGAVVFIAIYILAFVAVAAILIILHSSKSWNTQ